MKNLFLLPTDKPSRLWVNNLLQGKLELSEEVLPYNTSQNICITSDEEIKEENLTKSIYVIDVQNGNIGKLTCKNRFFKGSCKLIGIEWSNKQDIWNYYHIKEIILTTDQALIADGVQAIDEEFLEWFVKNPSCERVSVNKQYITPLGDVVDFCYDNERLNYKIIIPKEELERGITITHVGKGESNPFELPKALPDDVFYKSLEPKQETLEEFAKQEAIKQYSEDTFGNLIVRKSIEKGAKWQQQKDKKLYSEEDMIEFVEWIANTKLHGYSKQLYEAMIRYKVETTKELLKLWFEQFKIKGDFEIKYKVSIHQILEQFKKK
jgi:hypothetical protein